MMTGGVAIRMTLTAPNCPVAGTLPADVERAVRAVPGVTDVKLELIFDPPWTKDRMSEAAKLALGIEDIIPIARLQTMKLTANEEYGMRCLVRLGYAGWRARSHHSRNQPGGRRLAGLCRQAPARAAQGRIRESGARQGWRLHAGAPGGRDRDRRRASTRWAAGSSKAISARATPARRRSAPARWIAPCGRCGAPCRWPSTRCWVRRRCATCCRMSRT